MRNPFTVLKSVVSSLFKGRKPAPPVYSPKPQPAPISREEPRAHTPESRHNRAVIRSVKDLRNQAATAFPDLRARQRARNQRRKARAEVRAFVLKLNRARG